MPEPDEEKVTAFEYVSRTIRTLEEAENMRGLEQKLQQGLPVERLGSPKPLADLKGYFDLLARPLCIIAASEGIDASELDEFIRTGNPRLIQGSFQVLLKMQGWALRKETAAKAANQGSQSLHLPDDSLAQNEAHQIAPEKNSQNEGNKNSPEHIPPANGNKAVNAKPMQIRLIIEGVLIWLFWGLADFLGSHGHPHLSDLSFYGFFVSLMAVFASILNTFWPRTRTIYTLYFCACVALGFLMFANAGDLMSISTKSNLRFVPPVILSVAAITAWYLALRPLRPTASPPAISRPSNINSEHTPTTAANNVTIPPATTREAISRNSPGRSFQVLCQQLGDWKQGAIFTEYDFRQKNPAPNPNPGDDPAVATSDYYEGLYDRLLNLKAIRVVPTDVSHDHGAAITSLREILDCLPDRDFNADQRDYLRVACERLAPLKGRSAKLDLIVGKRETTATGNHEGEPRILAFNHNDHRTRLPIMLYAYFGDADAGLKSMLLKYGPGEHVCVAGTIDRADLYIYDDRGLTICIDLIRCTTA